MPIPRIILVLFFLIKSVNIQAVSLIDEANLLYSESEYEEALSFYQESLLSNPDDSYANLNLAFIYKEIVDYPAAIDSLTQYLSRHNDQEALIYLADLYYLSGDFKKALAELEKIKIKRNNYKYFIYRGLIDEELGKVSLALKHYQASLEIKSNSIALYRIGKINFKTKKIDKAIKAFGDLIKRDSSIRIVYYYLGLSYFNKHDYIKAHSYIEKAVNFYPDNLYLKEKLSLAKKFLGKKYFVKKRKENEVRRKEIILKPYPSVLGNVPKVKVKIVDGAIQLRLKSSGKISLLSKNKTINLDRDSFYTLKVRDKNIEVISEKNNQILGHFFSPLILKTKNNPFYVLGVVQGKGDFWQKSLDNAYRGNLEIRLINGELEIINILNVEEYLYGVLPSEIYPSAPDAALKAQAVAARTVALGSIGRHKTRGYDFCSSVHCQAYKGMNVESPSTNKIINQTQGEAITFKGNFIETFYHANCGGALRGEVFGKKDYLVAKFDREIKKSLILSPLEVNRWFKQTNSSFCSLTKRESSFRWQIIYDAQDFELIFGYPISELREIKIINKGESLHLDAIEFVLKQESKIIKGDLNIRKYFGGLRSNAFFIDLKYRKQGAKRIADKLIIWGSGFGHGVGMCQEGAQGMAEQGFSYQEILTHYYEGVEVKKAY